MCKASQSSLTADLYKRPTNLSGVKRTVTSSVITCRLAAFNLHVVVKPSCAIVPYIRLQVCQPGARQVMW